MSSKTILIFTASQDVGGAERVISVMSNYWATQGWNVILITQKGINRDFYPLHSQVTRIGMDLYGESRGVIHALGENYKRIRFLKQSIKQYKPDAIISFLTPSNVLAIIAAMGTRIPVIVSERCNPLLEPSTRIWRIARQLTYRYASTVVIQTSGMIDWARTLVKADNITIIPNPVEPQLLKNPTPDCFPLPKGKVIISMGRLSRQKAFHELIGAFANIAQRHPEAYLVILGEGKLRAELEALIDNLALKARIFLPGNIQNPHTLLAKADIIALSSHFEGFPNALLEGMSLGLAPISYDCEHGPKDLIDSGVSGLLIPTGQQAALSDGIDTLLSNPDLVQKLGEHAKNVNQRFAVSVIMHKWETLINELLSRPSHLSKTVE